MSLITEDLLVRAGALPAGAALYAAPLAASCDKRGIVSQPAICCFLANVMNESAAMTKVVEDTYYTSAPYLYSVFRSHFTSVADAAKYTRNSAALAAKVYGNMQGRGLMDTTGLANYADYATAVGKTVAEIGPYMETPEGAADSAAFIFVHNGCLSFADKGDLLGVTRRIEGGQNPIGMKSVQTWYNQVVKAFGGTPATAHPVATTTHAGSGVAYRTAAQPTADDLNAQSLAGTLNLGTDTT